MKKIILEEVKQVEKEVINKYRYACPACTNVAFYSPERSLFLTKVCQSCGKTIAFQAENYIKL